MDQGLKNRFLTSFGMTFYFKGVWGKDMQKPVIPNEAKRNEESVFKGILSYTPVFVSIFFVILQAKKYTMITIDQLREVLERESALRGYL